MMKSNIKRRLEQDGLYVDTSDHWEMFETKTSIYTYHGCTIYIPIDIVRHLKLKHRDEIVVAIKRRKP